MHGDPEDQVDADRPLRFRVGLVCAVRLYRDALCAALERTGDLVLAGSAATADALIAANCAADAFLVDIAGGIDRTGDRVARFRRSR